MIMRDVTTILKERQCGVRREMDRRQISLTMLHHDSGIPYSTLASYFPVDCAKVSPAIIPMTAVYALCGHLPDELLSLLLPDGMQIVRASEEIDHDELAAIAQEYLIEKSRTHSPDSPGGREITPEEDAALCQKAARLRMVP